MGGDIAYVPISAKQGTGVDDLFENILLINDMVIQNLSNDKSEATGQILEKAL